MAGKNVLWLRSIPSTKPSGDDHDQYDLQRQTDDRGEARNAIEKSVPEQPAKQTCAKETGSDPAEQSAAEQARTDCSLADGRGACDASTDIGCQLVISFRAGASPSRVSLKICHSVKVIPDDHQALLHQETRRCSSP
jgi:hypothetical protein